MSEIHDGEDLWQWPRLEIRLNAFRRSTIRHKQFILIIIIIITRPPHQKLVATALITKIFYFYTLTILLPLTFSNFFDWNNPPILWSRRSTAFKQIARQFKILAILYFHRFLTIFNLTLQQCFLWLNWMELVDKVLFSIPFTFENI